MVSQVAVVSAKRPISGTWPVPNMPNFLHTPKTGLLLSGGLDSAILLGQLLSRGWYVTPFHIRTGCFWQQDELLAVDRFLARISQPNLDDLVVFDMPLGDLYGEHWSMSGFDVPNDLSPDEAVFLPGRNPLLLLKPALWCRMNGIDHLALATLSNNPFPDATPDFFAQFEAMLHKATGRGLQIARPFEHLTKNQVLQLGRDLPLELTFSCLAPSNGLHCGHCNKCAERGRAFSQAGILDRTRYAVPLTASIERR